MGLGTGTGTRPWVRVWVRVRHVTNSWVRVRVWVRDHRYGNGYGYGTMGMGTMGTGIGTGPRCQVADEDCGYNDSYATLYLGTCTWVPNRIWDFGELSHCD